MSEPQNDLQNDLQKDLSFEDALRQLEERVRELERGEVPLERALALYEEGVGLVRACHDKLDAADRRIVELSSDPAGRPQGG